MSGAITWSELISQPDRWTVLLDRLARPGELPQVSLDEFDEVVLVGSGTSYYLAMAAADWIRRHHAVAVRAVPSCEVMLDPLEVANPHGRRRLAIGFSRSGESSELVLAVKAMKLAGFTVLAVSCSEGSSLLRLSHHVFHIPEGHEDGLVMLRSFTSMLMAVQFLFGTDADRQALRALPEIGRRILAQHASIQALAQSRPFDRFVFLASGPHYPLAVEASLKIQEMAISTSEAYQSLEYRHGPKATADAETLVSLMPLSDRHHGLALARDLKALGVALLVTGPGAADYVDIADLTIDPAVEMSAGVSAATTLLPLQVMAFETAIRRGQDPDAPVNLAKVVLF
ncbi:MAG TPA: SIS domain-containing protein [Devosia sp.]|nr:SIS domain-containing protein [Devosia sp.]